MATFLGLTSGAVMALVVGITACGITSTSGGTGRSSLRQAPLPFSAGRGIRFLPSDGGDGIGRLTRLGRPLVTAKQGIVRRT